MIRICLENNQKKGIKQWFELPMSVDTILAKMKLDDQEYTIVEYEAPFKIGVHENLDQLNEIAELWEEHDGNEVLDYIQELVSEGYYSNNLEALENIDNIFIYSECQSFASLARYFIDENMIPVGTLPDIIRYNIDYVGIGNDLRMEGNYYQANDGVILEIC